MILSFPPDGRAVLRLPFSRRHILLAALTGAVGGFLFVLVWAWKYQIGQQVTCSNKATDPLAYIELALKDQHPIEPTYGAELFFLSKNSALKNIDRVTFTRSKVGTYGNEEHAIQTSWSDAWGLHPSGATNVTLVSAAGLHRNFPFDSALFDFSLRTSPELTFPHFRLVNRVPGFIVDCEKAKVVTSPGQVDVYFSLKRSPLTQLFVCSLSLALGILILPILLIKRIEARAAAVASYFFSAMSLRTVISEQIKVFPTLFDCWVLTCCIVMLVFLMWSVLVKAPATRPNNFTQPSASPPPSKPRGATNMAPFERYLVLGRYFLHWLRDLLIWIVIKPFRLWVTIGAPFALYFVITQFSSVPEVRVRYTGMYCELLGLLVVAIALYKTQRSMNRPGLIAAALAWIKSLPRFGPKQTTIIVGAGDLHAQGASVAGMSGTLTTGASHEERISALEEQIGNHSRAIDAVKKSVADEAKKRAKAIENEASKRVDGDKAARDLIADFATGDLYLELMGAAWLLIGIFAATASTEIVRWFPIFFSSTPT